MNINLTPIIQAIIALLAALITYKLIPWIKARTTNEQQALLKATIKTMVFAAEQLYGAKNGAEKLDWVIYQLSQRGYRVDRSEIEAIIKENVDALHTYSPSKTKAREEETEAENEKPPEE
nr:MAG TPA: holin [Caudoviricetes sp.]